MKRQRKSIQKNRVKRVFIASLIVVLFISFFWAVFGYRNRNFPQQIAFQYQSVPSISEYPISSPTISQESEITYNLRNFSTDDIFFEKEKYPLKLTSLADASLRRFYCSGEYRKTSNGYVSYDPISRTETVLTDRKLLSYLQKITEKYNNPPNADTHFFPSIQYCDVENGPSIFFYRVGPCGGGCDGIQHIALMSEVGENQFDNEVNPSVEGVPYYGCTLLAVDRQNFQLKEYGSIKYIYLLCKAEGYASVEYIDLSSNVHESIKSCRSEIMEPNAPYQCWEK